MRKKSLLLLKFESSRRNLCHNAFEYSQQNKHEENNTKPGSTQHSGKGSEQLNQVEFLRIWSCGDLLRLSQEFIHSPSPLVPLPAFMMPLSTLHTQNYKSNALKQNCENVFTSNSLASILPLHKMTYNCKSIKQKISSLFCPTRPGYALKTGATCWTQALRLVGSSPVMALKSLMSALLANSFPASIALYISINPSPFGKTTDTEKGWVHTGCVDDRSTSGVILVGQD